MKLRARNIDIETGATPVVILNEHFALLNDVHPLDRAMITHGKSKITVVIEVSTQMIFDNEIGLFAEVWKKLGVMTGEMVEFWPIEKPKSIDYIRKKLNRETLDKNEIRTIVDDIVNDKLTDTEISAFVTASYMGGLSTNETFDLTNAMVDSGEKLTWKKRVVADKHSIGGVPGRISMIIVPIVAAAGILIPKTSSKAITSPAGTADSMEVLAPVSFDAKELKRIAQKTNGCIAWGGALNLAPADDKIIKAESPLSLDPEGQLLASVMSKKISVGATHIVIDLPVGEGCKLNNIQEARHLQAQFSTLADRLGVRVNPIITDASQPLGNGIGPSLEAKDVLLVLANKQVAPQLLKEKALFIAGTLLEFCNKVHRGQGIALAEHILKSGKAMKKMLEIIEAQGGDPKINAEKISFADKKYDVLAPKSGIISVVNNKILIKIARMAGAPVDKEAGIMLYKHLQEKVKAKEKLFTIYAKSERNIDSAVDIMQSFNAIEID